MNNIEDRGDCLQSLRHVFHALTKPALQIEGLPNCFEDLQIVDIYNSPGLVQKGDWEAYLNDQDEAWIITPIYYLGGGLKIIRKALGGGRWDGRSFQGKMHEGVSWNERKYRLVGRAGLRNYTMIEYLHQEDQKPKHALCRITVENNNNYAHDRPPSSSQQRNGMEIDDTDTDTDMGANVETSLSHEPTQQGDNFENAPGCCNQLPVLEEKVRELRSQFSDDDILKVFYQIQTSEKIPAAIRKRHRTKARVSHLKLRCGTDTNTMKAGTSRKRPKVEMLESNSYRGDTTNLHHDNNTNCLEFGEQSSHHGNCNEKNAEQGTNTSNFDDIIPSLLWEDVFGPYDPEMLESNSYRGDTTNLHHDNNTNCLEFGEQSSHHGNCNEKNAEEGTNTSNFDGVRSWSFQEIYNSFAQEIESNSVVQQPIQSSSNVIADSAEQTDNQNRIAPDPSTSNFATTEVSLGHQMLDSNPSVQDLDNLSINFNANSTEGMENRNQLPSYNQNTIAPGPSTSTHATIGHVWSWIKRWSKPLTPFLKS